MIIVNPSVELLSITRDAEKLLEKAGRTCYKSEDKITDDSAARFIGMICNRSHASVLEHASASFRFVCDRGVTHEMVRHRLAAFSQESTRYCNYGKGKFQGQINVIEPPFKTDQSKKIWTQAMKDIETVYLGLLKNGESPEMARSVLPNCLKTEIVMTCNFREWLHVFNVRTSPAAHPQIAEVMEMAREILQKKCPAVFGAPGEPCQA